MSDAFLARQEGARRFNWQYYLVKYPAMRRGDSGLYVPNAGAMGFGLCMLNKTQLNSYYRDPYLSAIIERSGAREGEHVEDTWFYGWDCYSPDKRWIKLLHSGYRVLSCREDGFQLRAPEEAAELAVFDAVCRKHGVGADLVLRMPQAVVDDTVYDERDRIEAAANLLGDLIAGHAAAHPARPARNRGNRTSRRPPSLPSSAGTPSEKELAERLGENHTFYRRGGQPFADSILRRHYLPPDSH